jgi:hypothetical protein
MVKDLQSVRCDGDGAQTNGFTQRRQWSWRWYPAVAHACRARSLASRTMASPRLPPTAGKRVSAAPSSAEAIPCRRWDGSKASRYSEPRHPSNLGCSQRSAIRLRA